MKNPATVLLIDAVGALVTFLFTACLLAPEWIPTGLPTLALIFLAVAAGGLLMTSLFGYLTLVNYRPRLRLVAVLNTSYCVATISLCMAYWSRLTLLGAIYFTLEVMIVLALVTIELRTATAN